MKTVGVLLILLMITVASEAGGCKKLNAKIDDLAKKVTALTKKEDDTNDNVAALTTKVDTLIQNNDDIMTEIKALEDLIVAQNPNNSPYVKLNSDPVCFGTLGSQFGSFKASTGGKLMKIKLVHLYGYVSCIGTEPKYWSHWGCGYFNENSNTDWTGISITTAGNTVLFPPKEINRGTYHWALIPGYNSRTPELVMSIYDNPVEVTTGQQLRVWYSEDLYQDSYTNNHGRVCADVFGYFMQ